jgi:hypothetical protein
MTAGSTSELTFRVRVGGNGSGTHTMNGRNTAQKNGWSNGIIYNNYGDCSMTLNAKAVYALYTNAVKTVEDKAFDVDDNEITLNMTDINNWVDPNAYVDKRVAEYPPIAEQLDDIYHNGVDEWKNNHQSS